MKHNGFNGSDFTDNPIYLGNNKNLIVILVMQYDTIQVILVRGCPHFVQTKIEICKLAILKMRYYQGVIQSLST